MAGEVLTQGCKLLRGTGTGSPETFVEVAGIQSFSGPNPTRDEIDATTLASVAKQFKMGLVDYGEMTFELLYLPSEDVQQDIEGSLNADDPTNWKFEYSDGDTSETFSAFVKAFPKNGGVNDLVKASLTLRITGAVTRVYPT